MGRELGVTGGDALVLASVGVDLHVAPVVTGTLGVHAVLRDDAFRVTERLRLWLERGPSGYWLRDAATGEPVRWGF